MAEGRGRRVIVVNTTFRRAPWADVLYACDRPWWAQYGTEVRSAFCGECWSTSVRASREFSLRHVNSMPAERRMRGSDVISRGLNSGHQALGLAVLFGAARVVLLGYDFQRTGGQSHWHGNHPAPLGNLGSVDRWVIQMGELAAELASLGVQVVNATRETALRCFPRVSLADALT